MEGVAATIGNAPTTGNRTAPYDPVHSAATSEAKEKFREAFAQLPQREREIAVMLYVEHLTLAEVGEVLGVTESRISQIHTAMKHKLRGALEADAEILRLVA